MTDNDTAATVQPNPEGEGAPEEEPQRPAWSSILFQLAVMYMMWNFAFGSRGAQTPAASPVAGPADVEAKVDAAAVAAEAARVAPASGKRFNLWTDGQAFDLRVYASVDETFTSFASNEALLWHLDSLSYDWNEGNEHELALNYTLPAAVLANTTLYAHIYATKEGFSPDPTHPSYHPHATIYLRHHMTRHLVKKAKGRKRHLLGGTEETEEEASEVAAAVADVASAGDGAVAEAEEDTIQLYWQPTMDLRAVHDFTAIPATGWPLEDSMLFDEVTGHYFPTLFVNDFWVLREHMVEVNGSRTEMPLALSYNTFGQLKWQLQVQMTQSWKMQAEYGAASDGDTDQFKRMLLDNNPYLLALTACVSMLHMAFEFLAFKNDVQFWNKRKSMEGLSVRTLFMSLFFQVVITLYLFDNDTSWMILISSSLETVMSFWKISKAVKLKWVNWRGRQVPWFQDRVSYAGSETKQYDEEAMRHLMLMLYPMVAGTALYSLVFNQHKSWYSWVISSLVSFIYVFGFIRMTPQLYINYRLQSVAHMPWRAMTYKSLNTVIDDLFAFIVTMPLMHRLACFRDDIIFVIYLYQRWIYRVDPSRVNEYGQSGEDDQPGADKPAIAPTASADPSKESLPASARKRRTKFDRR